MQFYLLASFHTINYQYLSLILYLRIYCCTLTKNFYKRTLRKLLIFFQGNILSNILSYFVFVKNWKRGFKNWTKLSGRGDDETLNFLIKMYVSYVFLTQININCNKCTISSHVDFYTVHVNLYAQKSWKRTCPGFNLVTPLIALCRWCITGFLFG